MHYQESVVEGTFIGRPNRFIAHIIIQGNREIAHVKNTGRCKELLIPGATVYVLDHGYQLNRKTRFSLVAVVKNGLLINMDSQAPNKIWHEYLEKSNVPFLANPIRTIKQEKKYENSRFDFYLETQNEKVFMEVKGVTLENNKVAKFPDAPTERGVKHMKELMHAARKGYKSYIVFIIQMQEVNLFQPNDATHPLFGETLREAADAGIHILAYSCKVSPGSITIDHSIPIDLLKN